MKKVKSEARNMVELKKKEGPLHPPEINHGRQQTAKRISWHKKSEDVESTAVVSHGRWIR